MSVPVAMQLEDLRDSFGLRVWSGVAHPVSLSRRQGDIEINIADADIGYLIDDSKVRIPAGRAAILCAAHRTDFSMFRRPHRSRALRSQIYCVASAGRRSMRNRAR